MNNVIENQFKQIKKRCKEIKELNAKNVIIKIILIILLINVFLIFTLLFGSLKFDLSLTKKLKKKKRNYQEVSQNRIQKKK
jgi:hypothetical protein